MSLNLRLLKKIRKAEIFMRINYEKNLSHPDYVVKQEADEVIEMIEE